MYRTIKDPKFSKRHPEKAEESQTHYNPDLKLYYTPIVIKTVQ